ncbi:MAG TPA: DNA recombination protein RmuC [Bacilli bacterium]|nr:DNA recombination protein RmuC [Bacilli bacterium]
MQPYEYVLLGLMIIILIVLAVLIFLTLRKKEVAVETKVDGEMHAKLATLQAKLEELNKDITHTVELTLSDNAKKEIASDAEHNKKLTQEIANKLGELNKEVKDALLGANKSQGETLTNLGKQIQALQTANESVSKLGESVSTLTNVITGNNQKRGQFGEFLLTSILENIFETTSNMFSTQYDLDVKGSKVRPDAVIYLPKEKGNIICIDSKFPYANYLAIFNEDGSENEGKIREFKEDVKRKIDEISSKYIVKGLTADYALCYFPSDEIYNFINAKLPDLAEKARKSAVVLVSPATLQPVLYTLKALAIEYKRSQKLQELNLLIVTLSKDFRILRERWDKIEANVTTLQNSVSNFNAPFNRLEGKFEKISDAADVEVES